MCVSDQILELLSSHPLKFTIALDTNIVSFLSRRGRSRLHSVLALENCTPIVSDIILKELNKDTSGGEVRYLSDLYARQIRFYDPINSSGLVTTHHLEDIEPHNPAAELIEESLFEFSRKFIGTKSETDIVKTVTQANLSVADWLEQEGLAEGANIIRSKNKALVNDLPAVLTETGPVNSERELTTIGMGRVNLGNLRAPNIIKKIVLKIPKDEADGARAIFVVPENPSDYRVSMLCMAFVLLSLGFARDKRIGKRDKTTSKRGMASQFRDCQHIAASAGTDIFLTADRDCARIAFAVYEHFQIRTSTWFLEKPSGENPVIRLVGGAFWP